MFEFIEEVFTTYLDTLMKDVVLTEDCKAFDDYDVIFEDSDIIVSIMYEMSGIHEQPINLAAKIRNSRLVARAVEVKNRLLDAAKKYYDNASEALKKRWDTSKSSLDKKLEAITDPKQKEAMLQDLKVKFDAMKDRISSKYQGMKKSAIDRTNRLRRTAEAPTIESQSFLDICVQDRLFQLKEKFK